MTLDEILDVTSQIKPGQVCEYLLDVTTKPSPGMSKVVKGERVLVGNMAPLGMYDAEVKKRLRAAKKDADAFHVGPLPWGERVGNTPIIQHYGKHYLQCIILKTGAVQAFIGRVEVDPHDVPDVFLRDDDKLSAGFRQGLNKKTAVIIRCYEISGIERLVPAD